MNNVFSFLRKKSIKLSAVYLACFWLILSSPASALDLQCNLAENARIKPEDKSIANGQLSTNNQIP